MSISRLFFLQTCFHILLPNSIPLQEPPIDLSLKDSFDRRLENALSKLSKGRSLDGSIKLLESCIKEQPNNPDLHLYLACANAGKAHVIARTQIDKLLQEKQGIKKPIRYSDSNLVMTENLDIIKLRIIQYSKKATEHIRIAKSLPDHDVKNNLSVSFYQSWINAILFRLPRSIAQECLPKNTNYQHIISPIKEDKELISHPKFNLYLSDILNYIGDYSYFKSYKDKNIILFFEENPNILKESFTHLEEYIHESKDPSIDLQLRLSILRENQSTQHISKLPRNERTPELITAKIQAGLDFYKTYYESNKSNWFCGLMYASKLYMNSEKDKCINIINSLNLQNSAGLPTYTLYFPKELRAFIEPKKLLPNEYRYITLASTCMFMETPMNSTSEFLSGISKSIEITNSLAFIKHKDGQFYSVLNQLENMIIRFIIIYLNGFITKNPSIELPQNINQFILQHEADIERSKALLAEFEKLRKKNKTPQTN